MVPEIAVLITCHNRKVKTISCLRNLFNQTGLNSNFKLEVFLTDLDKKTYDFYLWVNDDTQLLPNAVIELLACEMQFKNNSLICGAVSSPDGNQYTYGGQDRNGKAVIPNGQIQRCFNINGNCVLISKAVVDKIGIIDPIYPHAIGDFDYGLRALRGGFNVLTTRIYVGHCESNNLPKWCYRSTPLKERFKSLYSPLGSSHPYYFFIYERKHFGLHIAIIHFLSIHLRALIPSLWN